MTTIITAPMLGPVADPAPAAVSLFIPADTSDEQLVELAVEVGAVDARHGARCSRTARMVRQQTVERMINALLMRSGGCRFRPVFVTIRCDAKRKWQ